MSLFGQITGLLKEILDFDSYNSTIRQYRCNI